MLVIVAVLFIVSMVVTIGICNVVAVVICL